MAILPRESRQADATLDGFGSRGIDQTGQGHVRYELCYRLSRDISVKKITVR